MHPVAAPTPHADIWAALDALTDPEIPVISLREMGILREVREGCCRGVHCVGPIQAGQR